MPRVSVIIPTYNCAAYLGRAIDSILSQTFDDYEIVIVDDGSTDDTTHVLDRYTSRVRYHHQSNQGLSAARNAALALAMGDLIAYLDADDVWAPQKLERQVAYLDANRECGIVHSDFAIIDEDDRILHHSYNAEKARPVPAGYCVLDLLRRCHIQVPTVVERRECLLRVGMFDGRLRVAQDYFHWMALAMAGYSVGYIPESLAMYRRRKGSLYGNQKALLEDMVLGFDTLLSDKTLGRRFGAEARRIAQERLYESRRDLAYLERINGERRASRKRILRMILESPTRIELYRELAKSLLPKEAPEAVAER